MAGDQEFPFRGDYQMKKFARGTFYTVSVIVLLFLLLFFFSIGDYHVPATTATDSSLPTIDLNSYRFHSETSGDPTSEPLLILHGGPGADYRYLLSLKPLSRDFYLIYFDQRGTGLSPRVPSSELNIQQYLKDIDAFVSTYGKGKPVHIIGHSWGAMLAAAYAGEFPEKVKGLILAEPGFLKIGQMAEKTEGPSASVLVKAGWAYMQSMHLSNRNDPDAQMDYVFSSMMEGVHSEMYHLKKPLPAWRGGYIVFQQMVLKTMGDREIRKTLDFARGTERFPNRVLFLSGENSSLSGSSLQRNNMKFFPDAQLVIIKGAGHFMFSEEPDECIRAIRSYLNSL